MCGIAGFVGRGDRVDLASMTQALTHRGPDGHGTFVNAEAGVYLGHRRLAIVDLAGGVQPLWNEDGTVAVIYNGEIYNHLDLRAELTRSGHVFKTDHSDTEVLVHGYEEWGDDLPRRLNGMFAFAIYDARRRRLFLARDRFGEKPLYYYHAPGLFAFASELTALRKHAYFPAALDTRSLQKFFAFGYLPAPNTVYADTCKLPGGNHLSLDLATDRLVRANYWRFCIEPDESLADADEPRLAEELRHLIQQAVSRRLMSDVPLGLFLSSGIDSAAVLAGAAHSLPAAAIKTFTIGFDEASFDESAGARLTARSVGSSHNERMLSLEAARALLPEILARLDEPLGDPSLLPTALVSRFAREQVTVALSGDGGDELFAGYDPFRALELANWYSTLVPKGLHRGLRRLVDLLPPSERNMSVEFRLKRTLTGLSYPPPAWNPAWMSPVEPSAIRELFQEPLRLEELYEEAIALWERDPKKSTVDRTLEFFTTLYLQDDILAKADRASMMSSLESRAVFLDNDVVEFCRKLPSRFKYRNGTRKYLLRRALAPWLPGEVMRRPKKGFGIPLARWLRAFPKSPRWIPVHGINQGWVDRSWRRHQAGRNDSRMMLWCWLSLQGLLGGDKIAEMVA
jgi:asparagine synthase (glutamine-hydrolysing)